MRGARGVLVLSMYYRPEPNFITGDVADALAARGPVTVIAAHPNYPLGHFYEGVRRPWLPQRTTENGVVVWRLPLFPDRSRSKLRRLVSYLSFALLAVLFAPFVGGRPHTVWVYQTPFTTALAALWFKWVHRARLVFTCADLWPESFSATGVVSSGAVMRASFAYSRWINRRADRIVCSTRGTLERFARDGVPRERLCYVPVWVDGSPRGPVPEARPEEAGGEHSIVYAGNLGPAQALETVVHAAAELRRRGAPVRVDFYGSGGSEDELRALAAGLGAGNVHFHGRVEAAAAFAASERAFAQLVSLRASPLFRMTIPSKLPFAFAAGAPVLYGLEGEPAELAAASGGSLAFDSAEPASLVAAVEALLATPPTERAAMRHRLRAFFAEHFSPDALLAEYEKILDPVPAHARARRVAAAPAVAPREG
jgi:glycosyltransferase involved in cell wall biosynthesis